MSKIGKHPEELLPAEQVLLCAVVLGISDESKKKYLSSIVYNQLTSFLEVHNIGNPIIFWLETQIAQLKLFLTKFTFINRLIKY
jgi:hypothetical protein